MSGSEKKKFDIASIERFMLQSCKTTAKKCTKKYNTIQ